MNVFARSSCRSLSFLAAATLLGAGAGGCAAGSDLTAAPLSAVEEIPSPAAPGSGEANLFAARDGRVHMSWLERTDQRRASLRFATLGQSGWSEPVTIARGDSFFVNWADFPSVVELPDGRLAAHWLRRSGSGTYHYDVLIAQSADGGATWSEPVTPHRDGVLAEHGFVSLFPWEGDSLAAVWLDGRQLESSPGAPRTDASAMMLYHTTLHANGTPGVEAPLDRRVCECCQTGAAWTSEGPVVVYRNRTTEEIRDVAIVRRVNGVWSEPALVHADGWRINACPVNGPSVAARGERVVVAWFTAPNDTARVNVAFSDDAGATFRAPIRADDGQPIGRVAVLLDGDGAFVSWLERVDDGAEVRVRRVSTHGDRSAAVTVARSSAARGSGFPRMVRNGDRLTFAWTVPGDTSRVRVARATLNVGERSR